MSKNSPYLSIVIVGRNDNYGVNFMDRMNMFIRSLDYQISKHSKNFLELIIVEWNPLADQKPMKDVINLAKNFPIRVITVPFEIHNKTNNPSSVLEFYGKNVGIRRARGEFILVSNPDILFTQELIDVIAKQDLDINKVYRTDRYDYNGYGIENMPVDKYIEFAWRHTFHGHVNPASVRIQNPKSINDLPKSQQQYADHPFTNASGDFILSAKINFEKSHGLAWENETTERHVDSFSLFRLVIAGDIKQQMIFTAPRCIFHMDHERKSHNIRWNPSVAKQWAQLPELFVDNWGFANETLVEWSSVT